MVKHHPHLETLSQITALQGLSFGTLESIRQKAHIQTLHPPDVLYNFGDEAHTLYVIISGGLRLIEHTDEGKDVGLKIYGPGDLFGLLSISRDFVHPSRVEAILTSEVLCLHRTTAREIMLLHSDFALRVVDLLVEHIHVAHSRLRTMATERVDRRLARALLKYCEKFGKEDAHCILIDVPLAQQDLANFIGTTTESVNRTLKQWDKDGIVELSRLQIKILNRPALANIAETPST